MLFYLYNYIKFQIVVFVLKRKKLDGGKGLKEEQYEEVTNCLLILNKKLNFTFDCFKNRL